MGASLKDAARVMRASDLDLQIQSEAFLVLGMKPESIVHDPAVGGIRLGYRWPAIPTPSGGVRDVTGEIFISEADLQKVEPGRQGTATLAAASLRESVRLEILKQVSE